MNRMSMEVKYDEPLTPEARQYLIDRNQHELVAQIDAKYPPAEEQRVTVPDHVTANGLENVPTDELLAELNRREASGEDVWGAEADAGEDNGDSTPPSNTDYENWTNDELRAEAGDRGLSTSGKKEDLVARLKKSDQQA